MCTDHAVVQQLVGRIEDRRVITYGENPQADVRLVDLHHADGRSRFGVIFRDRAGETAHEIGGLMLPMPRPATMRSTRLLPSRLHTSLGFTDEAIRRRAFKNSAACGGASTRTGEWNGIPIIDDYGPSPGGRSPPCWRAAREIDRRPSDRGDAAAIATTRAVLPVRAVLHLLQRRRHTVNYRARLSGPAKRPSPGRRPRFAGAGFCAPAGHRQVIPARRALPISPAPSAALAPAGRHYRLPLAPGNITQWGLTPCQGEIGGASARWRDQSGLRLCDACSNGLCLMPTQHSIEHSHETRPRCEKELMELSPAERIELGHGTFWDSVAPQDLPPLTSEQIRAIDEELAAHEKGPDGDCSLGGSSGRIALAP